VRSNLRLRHLPLEARLSVAVAVVVALALAAIGLLVVARIHERVAREGRAGLGRTLTAALPALERGEVPRVPGTRLAWLEGGAAGGDRTLIDALRAGREAHLGTVAERQVGARRLVAVSRDPQDVERDLLLIEAIGLAPIGLVLVLVGVRLFERAGRRHRKQLETILDAAQRIGDGERDVALVAGRSEVGRVAGSLEHLAHGLRDLDRERGLYVSQVSHDLRNPLAVIGVYASVLRRGERSRPRAAQLQTIEDEVSRLALMVDDLLELGRTHSLALHIQRAQADVRALAAAAVAAARARSGATRVLLLARTVEMPAAVDGQRLRQALDNLLDNAIRHARSEVRVELTYAPGLELVLGVEDDGPGIDRDVLPHLFEPFAQGSQRVGGAGMGLSTVRAIAEAHGGGISAGIGRDGGTRFTLRLPLTPVPTAVA
jgi:signal transduction histidine kinase